MRASRRFHEQVSGRSGTADYHQCSKKHSKYQKESKVEADEEDKPQDLTDVDIKKVEALSISETNQDKTEESTAEGDQENKLEAENPTPPASEAKPKKVAEQIKRSAKKKGKDKKRMSGGKKADEKAASAATENE